MLQEHKQDSQFDFCDIWKQTDISLLLSVLGLNSFRIKDWAVCLKIKLCKSLDTTTSISNTCYPPLFAYLDTVVCSKAIGNEEFEFGRSDITLCAEFIDLCKICGTKRSPPFS